MLLCGLIYTFWYDFHKKCCCVALDYSQTTYFTYETKSDSKDTILQTFQLEFYYIVPLANIMRQCNLKICFDVCNSLDFQCWLLQCMSYFGYRCREICFSLDMFKLAICKVKRVCPLKYEFLGIHLILVSEVNFCNSGDFQRD